MEAETPFVFGYYPALLQLGLTYRCNLTCPHCYALYHRTRDEFTTSEVKALIDDAVTLGACKVVYSHGENLIRKDFHEIAAHIAKRDMFQTLMTNGYFLQTAEAVDQLRAAGINKVMVSIDSSDEGEHNANRGNRHAYEWALGALNALRKGQGLKVGISMAVDTRNYHRVRHVAQLARSLDLDFLSIMQTRPNEGHTFAMYDWSGYQSICREFYDLIVEHRGILDVYTHDPFMNTLLDDRISGDRDREAFVAHNACNVGKYMMSICPNGDVTGCNFIARSIGNLREEPLAVLWDRLMRDYDDSLTRRGPCGDCSQHGACQNGCKAFHIPYELAYDKRCEHGPYGTWPEARQSGLVQLRVLSGARL